MKYTMTNHHNFWQRAGANSDMAEAGVIFMWTDWPFRSQIEAIKSLGKKVVVWEHGFGAFSDYTNNHRPILADGYLAIGEESAKCVPNSLVVGNPIYDNVKRKRRKSTGKALYVALHWVHDVTEYNTKTLKELVDTYDEYQFDVKMSDKAKVDTTGIECEEWYTGVEGLRSLARAKNKISEYDVIFTPKAGTFDSFARLMGIPVYVINEHEDYRYDGDPISFKIEGDNYIRIGDKLEGKEIAMDKYIHRPSLDTESILDWVKKL